jgi:hypothetical protein
VEVEIHLFLILVPDAPASFLSRKFIQYSLEMRKAGPKVSPEAKENRIT